MKSFHYLSVFVIFLLLILLLSCSTKRPRGYELQSEVWERDEDDSVTKVYITGTLPIDSADINKLIYDFRSIEIDEYPQNLKVYARVYDSAGHFITNMADPYKKFPEVTYFTKVTEWLGKIHNIRESKIEKFNVREYGAKDSIPYNIVMTVDYSGSMEGVKEVIFDATEIFVSMKMDYDKIGLTTFNNNFDVKVPLTQDKQSILNLYSIKKNEGFGLFSAVYDAIDSAISMFEATPVDVPRVIVVFSDGDDNYSKADLSILYKKAKDTKTRIFAIGFGYSKDENLRYLAQQTGGKFYKAYSRQELISIFRDIYMSLRYFYLITYDPPDYWGYHKVISDLIIPGRDDTLYGIGEYNTSDMLDPWAKINDAFKRPIPFDFDSAVVKPESYPVIDEIVDIMMMMPRLMLEIQGHTDNIGTIEYNQDLSERRAKAVFNEIVKRGVSEKRLRWRGFGFSQPVASNDTEEGRAANRRTMFKILAR
jgi:hypothetical protein